MIGECYIYIYKIQFTFLPPKKRVIGPALASPDPTPTFCGRSTLRHFYE